MLLPRVPLRIKPPLAAQEPVSKSKSSGLAVISQRWRALREIFLSYDGTENEGPIQQEQATLLLGITLLFAFLGIGSCTLFTLAFEQNLNPSITLTDSSSSRSTLVWSLVVYAGSNAAMMLLSSVVGDVFDRTGDGLGVL